MSQSRSKVLNRFNRRWIQFSLRGVFIATIVMALWLGHVVSRAHNQKLVVSHVQESGGTVWFETDQPRFVEHWMNPARIPSTVPVGPDWLRTFLDDDYLRNAVQIDFRDATQKGFKPPNFEELGPLLGKLSEIETIRLDWRVSSDETLAALTKHSSLSRLNNLYVDGLVTDNGLEHVGRLSGLKTLNLPYTTLTDNGVTHLASLPHLHSLILFSTELTEKGIAVVLSQPNLRSVVLYNCAISEDRFASLANRHPEIDARLYFTSRYRESK